jgi:hypothetical protein
VSVPVPTPITQPVRRRPAKSTATREPTPTTAPSGMR